MVSKVTTPEQERLIVDLYMDGWSGVRIKNRLSISQAPIDRVLRENKIERRPFGSWSVGVPKTTTHEQEKMIIELYKAGLSKQSIESKTKIGRTVVARVLKDWNVNVRSSGGVRPYNVNSGCFDNLLEEKSAYWLGFLFADGAVHRTGINVALAEKDKDHLFLLEKFWGCGQRTKFFNSGKYKVARLDISDRPLANKMRDLGVEPHRPNGVNLLQKIPKTSLNHFLRGWFDGDGSAFLHPQLCFAGRPPFLMEVQKVFIEHAYANPVTLKWNGNPNKVIMTLVYRGVNRCNEIANYLYKDATIWLPRKRDRILSWPEPKRAREKRFWK